MCVAGGGGGGGVELARSPSGNRAFLPPPGPELASASPSAFPIPAGHVALGLRGSPRTYYAAGAPAGVLHREAARRGGLDSFGLFISVKWG